MDNSLNILVSVIIPVYNAEKYIKETLHCLIEQSHTNFEAIIIDDHSTDNSWDIITSFCNLDDRFTAYKNPKKGAASARNYGFSLSKGTYIQYLDADDILHKDKIRSQLDYITTNYLDEYSLVGCNWQRFKNSIHEIFGPIGPIIEEKPIYTNKEWLLNKPNMALMSWLFHRSLVIKTNGWNENLTRNDDGDFLYRVLALINQVVIIPKVLVYYRTEPSPSLSKGLDEKSMISWIASAMSYKRVVTEIIPEKGKIASDKFLYFLYYTNLYKHPTLAKKCLDELFYPNQIYEVGDRFVFKLAKFINIKNAKKIRIFINWVRGIKYV